MKKVTISLFCELIYQLRKKRSPWDTTDISLQKGTSKKERRPAGQRSENCKNLLGNLLPFIPFGFLLPIAYPRIKAFFKVFLVGMFAVLFIEIFQYMTRLGSFDIDDIILNMVGVLSGYGTFGLVNMFC